jgi:hypothetical protein
MGGQREWSLLGLFSRAMLGAPHPLPPMTDSHAGSRARRCVPIFGWAPFARADGTRLLCSEESR